MSKLITVVTVDSKNTVYSEKTVLDNCTLNQNDIVVNSDINLVGSTYLPEPRRFVGADGNTLLQL